MSKEKTSAVLFTKSFLVSSAYFKQYPSCAQTFYKQIYSMHAVKCLRYTDEKIFSKNRSIDLAKPTAT